MINFEPSNYYYSCLEIWRYGFLNIILKTCIFKDTKIRSNFKTFRITWIYPHTNFYFCFYYNLTDMTSIDNCMIVSLWLHSTIITKRWKVNPMLNKILIILAENIQPKLFSISGFNPKNTYILNAFHTCCFVIKYTFF